MFDSLFPATPLPAPLPDYARRALRQSSFASILKKQFSHRESIRIVSILDDNAENIPLLSALLPPQQAWMFCNADQAQTMLAVGQLAEWADRATMDHGQVILEKGARTLSLYLTHQAWQEAAYPWNETPDLWVLGGITNRSFAKIVRMVAQRAAQAHATVCVYDSWPLMLGWDEHHHEDKTVIGALAEIYHRESKAPANTLLQTALSAYGYNITEGRCSFTLPRDEAGAYGKFIQLIAEPLQHNEKIPYFLLQDWIAQKQSSKAVHAHYQYLLALPAR